MNILIENSLILTMSTDEVLKNNINHKEKQLSSKNKGYILIKDDLIEEVAFGEFKGNKENLYVINGEDYCVMPGLINCHTHSAMTLLRGHGEGYPLMEWLNKKIFPMEAKYSNTHFYSGNRLALLEMIKSGTTTFNDMYFNQDILLEVLDEFGMRAVLGAPIVGNQWREQLLNNLKFYEKVKNIKGFGDKFKVALAPHSPYALPKVALSEISAVAKETKYHIHIHIAETEKEVQIIKEKANTTPIKYLNDLGFLDNKIISAHSVHLDDEDLDIIKEKDFSAIYNPQSNMKLASGVARIKEMMEKGINVAIGTDGCASNNNLNLFEELETGAMLQKLWYKDATIITAEEAVMMATKNAAKALGYDNLGEIKKGYKADLIMVNLNRPSMTPVNNIYSNIVFSANGSEVDYVIIGGKIIMEKGELKTIDEEKIIFESKNSFKSLFNI